MDIKMTTTVNSNSSIALPLSLAAGGLTCAATGLGLCTIWAPVSSFGSSYFCVLYIMPHGALIGISLVFAASVFMMAPSPAEKDFSYQPPKLQYIEDVPGNGNCLLNAALKHIRRNRHYVNLLAASKLRKGIARAAIQEKDPDKQKAIIHDIAEARKAAREEKRENDLLFQPLFTQEMDLIFNSDTASIAWVPQIGQAYHAYILSEKGVAYLDQYAVGYLNQMCFNNRLLIVQQDRDTHYVKADALGFNPFSISQGERHKLPVLLYKDNHYQYVDSADEAFWEAYR
jgi:hypothetical protein